MRAASKALGRHSLVAYDRRVIRYMQGRRQLSACGQPLDIRSHASIPFILAYRPNLSYRISVDNGMPIFMQTSHQQASDRQADSSRPLR